MIDDHARTAELLRRRRAARALHPDDPAARQWLSGTLEHPHPAIAQLARSAQAGQASVGDVVAAVDEWERRQARTTLVDDWIATHSREDIERLAAAAGTPVPSRQPTVRMSDLPLSDRTRGFLHDTGMWSEEPMTLDLAAPDGVIREAPTRPDRR